MKHIYNLFITTILLLSTTAYMAADWSKGQWGHWDKSGWEKKSGLHKSPEAMARLIEYLQKQTITQPRGLIKKWHRLHADKLKLGAKEIAHQVIPQIDCPIKRAKYKKLVKTMFALAAQLKNLPVPDQPIKISLANKKAWLALKGREAALSALQLMVVAKQTGAKELLKKAQYKLKWAEKIRQALQLVKDNTEPTAYGESIDEIADSNGITQDTDTRDIDTRDNEEAVYFVVQEQQ